MSFDIGHNDLSSGNKGFDFYKTVVESLIIFLGIFVVFFCKAQTLPINTALNKMPAGAHLKDTNNEFLPFVGTYKANFNGNEIILFITKQADKLEKSTNKNYYMDALIVKYIVKNSAGIVLQDTKNNNLFNIEFYSIDLPAPNTVGFLYSGTNCSVGWGEINLKKISSTQISWEYRPDDITTTAAKCPPTLDTTIYLPETKDLIFTKQ